MIEDNWNKYSKYKREKMNVLNNCQIFLYKASPLCISCCQCIACCCIGKIESAIVDGWLERWVGVNQVPLRALRQPVCCEELTKKKHNNIEPAVLFFSLSFLERKKSVFRCLSLLKAFVVISSVVYEFASATERHRSLLSIQIQRENEDGSVVYVDVDRHFYLSLLLPSAYDPWS